MELLDLVLDFQLAVVVVVDGHLCSMHLENEQFVLFR